MKKKVIGVIVIIALVGVLYALYIFFMPKRDVQGIDAFAKKEAKELVNEFINNFDVAKAKYFESNGENKVLEVTGTVASKTKDLEDNYSVLLKGENQEAGVQVKFTTETNTQAESLIEGDVVTVKGFISQGASYDDLLEIYQHVILEKAAVINN